MTKEEREKLVSEISQKLAHSSMVQGSPEYNKNIKLLQMLSKQTSKEEVKSIDIEL